MTKSEFLSRLQRAISQLSAQEQMDIINDYEEHFRIGLEEGKTEGEIAEQLGSPEELGNSFVEEAQSGAPGAPPPYNGAASSYGAPPYGGASYQGQNGYPYEPGAYGSPAYMQQAPRSSGDKTASIVLIVLLTVFIVVPVGFGVAIGLWFAILAVGVVAGVLSALSLMATGLSFGFTLLGIAGICLTVCLLCGLVAYTWGVLKLCGVYFRFCSRTINGKEAAVL